MIHIIFAFALFTSFITLLRFMNCFINGIINTVGSLKSFTNELFYLIVFGILSIIFWTIYHYLIY